MIVKCQGYHVFQIIGSQMAVRNETIYCCILNQIKFNIYFNDVRSNNCTRTDAIISLH
jgi:hypothetical protein